MIALYAIAAAYATALLCAALTCAHRLAHALTIATPRSPPPRQGRPPSESPHSPPDAIANTPTHVLQWPRDN